MSDVTSRCEWVPAGDEMYVAYHDLEWGVPVRDERALFELLTLEGAQAGLSWRTILARRDGYRAVFAGFDVEAVAGWDDTQVAAALADARIIRNRLKVLSTRDNARAVVRLHRAGTSLSRVLWGFVGGEPIVNAWETLGQIPASTPEAESMSKALRELGFRFVGPTICYALMQSAGLVNDHVTSCFRYREVGALPLNSRP
jgi:DNA-3-methyladenine glycosylase I